MADKSADPGSVCCACGVHRRRDTLLWMRASLQRCRKSSPAWVCAAGSFTVRSLSTIVEGWPMRSERPLSRMKAVQKTFRRTSISAGVKLCRELFLCRPRSLPMLVMMPSKVKTDSRLRVSLRKIACVCISNSS